jgi:hypothetical protein
MRMTTVETLTTYIGAVSTLAGLTDVSMDITNFPDGLLIQPDSDGSAPTTGTLSTAIENIGIGHGAFSALTSGDYNTAVGSRAGTALTEGSENQLFGKGAGNAITTGQYNHIFGMNAGSGFDTESHNVAFGLSALGSSIAGGEYNTAIGNFAGDDITSGDNNTCLGYQAGTALTSGTDNTVVGYQAGVALTGLDCTAIGKLAGGNGISNENCMWLGHDSQPTATNVDNQITMGDGNISSLRCAVTSISAISDRRDKEDIVDSPFGLDFINSVRPVQFKWNRRILSESDENNVHDGQTRIGFIAQELNDAMPDNENEILNLVYESNPERMEVSPGQFTTILVKAVQELSAQVKELKAKLEDK